MAVSDIESVLEFLRKNGFSDSESALREDLLEKSKLRSFDFEKFLFPMVPPPPPLKIPAIQRRPEVEEAGGGDLSDDSSEEFVSLCSSDFTNPYGIQTMTRVSSQASSDRLSQFGTACDYQDFDMQNDLYWYNEGDEDYTVPPHFGRRALPVSGLKSINLTDDLHIPVAEKDFRRNGKKDYEGGSATEEATDPHEPEGAADEEEGITAYQLLMYDINENEYEVFNLRIIHRKNRTGFEENKDLPIVLNSIIAGRYYVKEYLGSAAFSKVVQAHDVHTGMDVCLKIINNDKDFFDQSLDEIKLLKFVNKHDPGDERHILRLYDYFYYQFITRQCLEALEYLHHLGIIHCDLKPENILIKSYKRCEIKVIDLGSSCFQTDNLCLYIQSRSYRAPEVILGLPYDQKIDLWSLGCILAELCSGEVLFPNDGLVMLLARLIGILGPIDMEMLENGQETHKYFTEDYDLYFINEDMDQLEYVIPESSSLEHHLQVSDTGFIDFLRDLLEINPQRRPTAREALEHPWLSHQYELNS
ncbi:protein kinase superfamily protein [Actinidia rufa]|uniref:Protein kinase superfamily protein n=1 Tax=Actinidia rufa TaxID=165716 RepID=A0A7J0EE81_9ERIC|nr:protein kinase superfamily protein [Actinidia rufa]